MCEPSRTDRGIQSVCNQLWPITEPSKSFTCRNCGGRDRGRVAIYRPLGEFRRVTCMVLKANDRRTSCPCHDEFRGPRSDYVRQVASENNNNTGKFKK
ncbi:uncharacterized protein TNCV_1223901 [Trichonephila clavipes]|nr:uncharacterized protein TNCV_1223901 [Trichonephila clavipes]